MRLPRHLAWRTPSVVLPSQLSSVLGCRWKILNPASMKQALVEGAIRLPGLNLYEQVRSLSAALLTCLGSRCLGDV